LLKVNGAFEPVSWDLALGVLVEKLGRLAQTQPESILYYQGFGSRTALKLLNRRFFNLLGPITTTKGTICGGAGQGAQDLDYGARISHDVRDHENSSMMVLWGRNPSVTSLNLLPVMRSLQSKGRPVVLIDPVHTASVSLCSMWLAPRPGTDAQLALALSRLVLEAGAEDREFLENRCEGFSAYKEMVFSEDLAARAAACDLSQEEVKALAQTLMAHKPVSFVLGWGLHRWRESQVTIRSIDALGAVVGSIGVPGGGVSQGFEEYQPYDWSVWGDELRPNRRRLFMPLLGEELEKADPPIEAALFTAGNPAATLPDSRRVQAALRRIPFMAVSGHFLDDTASLADLFLPATTFLEEDDVVAAYGHSYVCPVNPAIEPLGESRSDFDLFMELGRRFGFSDYVKPKEEWLKIVLAPTLQLGLSLEEIKAGGAWQPDVPHVPFPDRVFPTPTGKFNLIGEFTPPASYDPERRFALMSVSPKEWLCSEIHPFPRPKILPVTVNSAVAESLNIAEGEEVWIRNSQGRLRAQARLDPELRADVAVVPRGGWDMDGCNVNVLTQAVLTSVGDGTAYFESRVDLEKIESS
jgi:anaerobic selenocysteine-containing dehydrogenase